MPGRRRPYWVRGCCLALAAFWGLALVVASLTITASSAKHGHGVSHTVFSDNPLLWIVTVLGVVLVLAVAALELASRARLGRTGPGTISLVLGSLLCVYSLLGLLAGIAAVAPIGALVIVSGTALSRRATPSPDPV